MARMAALRLEKGSMMWRSEYNDAYETCERTAFELRIHSERHPTQALTDTLGMMPTKIEPVRDGAEMPCWVLSSERYVKSLDSRRHVERLLDRLETRASALHALQAAPGVQMWSRCIWWSKYSEGGPILWPEHMTRLAALGLGLRYEIVFSSTTF
jgi:hypothetical protein